MKKSTNKKSGVGEIKAWAVYRTSKIYTPAIHDYSLAIFPSKKLAENYAKTGIHPNNLQKITEVLITPLSPVSSNKPKSNKRIGKKGR